MGDEGRGRFIPRRGWSEEPPRHPKTKERGFRRPSPEGRISPPRSPPRGRETPTPDIGVDYPWVFVSDILQKTINPKNEYFWDIYSQQSIRTCLLYTSDAADERSSVDLGGRRIIKKKKKKKIK